MENLLIPSGVGSSVIAKIEEGLRQSDAGQLEDHDEVKKRFLS